MYDTTPPAHRTLDPSAALPLLVALAGHLGETITKKFKRKR